MSKDFNKFIDTQKEALLKAELLQPGGTYVATERGWILTTEEQAMAIKAAEKRGAEKMLKLAKEAAIKFEAEYVAKTGLGKVVKHDITDHSYVYFHQLEKILKEWEKLKD